MKKNVYKPVYKKKLRIRDNILENKSPLSFKKKKWRFLLSFLKNKNKKKFFDPYIRFKPKFGSFFQKKFKQNLLIKQKISSYYGFLLLKDFKRMRQLVYKSVIKTHRLNIPGNLESFIFKLVENRLDILLFRTYFAKSIREARFFIYSGQILINGFKSTNHSIILKQGDFITFKSSLTPKIIENLSFVNISHSLPKHVLVNYKTFQICIAFDVEKVKLFDLHSFKIDFQTLLKKV